MKKLFFDYFDDDLIDLAKFVLCFFGGIMPSIYVFFENYGMKLEYGFEGVLGQFLMWMWLKKYKTINNVSPSLVDLFRDFVLSFFISMLSTEVILKIFPNLLGIEDGKALATTLIAICCGAFYEKIIKRIFKKAEDIEGNEANREAGEDRPINPPRFNLDEDRPNNPPRKIQGFDEDRPKDPPR